MLRFLLSIKNENREAFSSNQFSDFLQSFIFWLELESSCDFSKSRLFL